VYVEGTLYPAISLLEIGRDLMIPQGWEGNYGVRTLPFIHLMIYIGLVYDKFCLVLYDR
jgi:hypothetical protein